jgi:hypothetical protein
MSHVGEAIADTRLRRNAPSRRSSQLIYSTHVMLGVESDCDTLIDRGGTLKVSSSAGDAEAGGVR